MVDFGSVQHKVPYFFVVLHAIFDPLQRFLNYFVYQMPLHLIIQKSFLEVGHTGGGLYRMLRFR
jgi:hypothetical protein